MIVVVADTSPVHYLIQIEAVEVLPRFSMKSFFRQRSITNCNMLRPQQRCGNG